MRSTTCQTNEDASKESRPSSNSDKETNQSRKAHWCRLIGRNVGHFERGQSDCCGENLYHYLCYVHQWLLNATTSTRLERNTATFERTTRRSSTCTHMDVDEATDRAMVKMLKKNLFISILALWDTAHQARILILKMTFMLLTTGLICVGNLEKISMYCSDSTVPDIRRRSCSSRKCRLSTPRLGRWRLQLLMEICPRMCVVEACLVFTL